MKQHITDALANFHEYYHIPSIIVIVVALLGISVFKDTPREIDAALTYLLLLFIILLMGFIWHDTHNIKMQINKLKGAK